MLDRADKQHLLQRLGNLLTDTGSGNRYFEVSIRSFESVINKKDEPIVSVGETHMDYGKFTSHYVDFEVKFPPTEVGGFTFA